MDKYIEVENTQKVFIHGFLSVMSQNRGSIDYPSTRGIQVDVGLPDTTSENQAESPLYGELYPNTIPAYPVPNSAIKSNNPVT